jgi:hypothetical protein
LESIPVKHTTPWTRTDRSVSGSVGDELERGVDSVRDDPANLPGQIAIVDQHMVDADVSQGCSLVRVASGGQDEHLSLLGKHCRGHAD